MQHLSIAFLCTLAILRSAFSVVEFTVVLSVPLLDESNSLHDAPDSTNACELLKSRGRTQWDSGLFTGCITYGLMLERTTPAYEMQITMNETKFPWDYNSLTVYERAWEVNRLLNMNASGCSTIVTTGEVQDVYGSAPVMDSAVNVSFILIGPADRDTCSEVTSKREYASGHFMVENCTQIEVSVAHTSSNTRLARYKLIVNPYSLFFNPSDYSLPFVAELNGDSCRYNGYWPPVHSWQHTNLDEYPLL
ncbi:unnamed protein product [Dicrocoelium dendriticum]|nr:unnamed protein product [Dicrocoelium dendriticum]